MWAHKLGRSVQTFSGIQNIPKISTTVERESLPTLPVYTMCNSYSSPPDFFKGSCDPHPANAEKRHRIYRLFWGLLNDFCVFRDLECLRRRESQTVRVDQREILPTCILKVYNNIVDSRDD